MILESFESSSLGKKETECEEEEEETNYFWRRHWLRTMEGALPDVGIRCIVTRSWERVVGESRREMDDLQLRGMSIYQSSGKELLIVKYTYFVFKRMDETKCVTEYNFGIETGDQITSLSG